MDIKEILNRVKNGELDIDAALELIEEDEVPQKASGIIKKLTKEDVKKIIARKKHKMERDEEAVLNIPEGLDSINITCEKGQFEFYSGKGKNFRIEGDGIRKYDKGTNTLYLKASKGCEVYIPETVKNIKMKVSVSAVEVKINGESITIEADKSNVEGSLNAKSLKLQSTLGNIEFKLTNTEEAYIKNKLGNIELKIADNEKYTFKVSNSMGSIEIDENLKGEGGEITIENSLGNIEIS